MIDREREKSLLKSLPAEDNARVLFMTEGNEELGWVAVSLQERTLRLLKFSLPSCKDYAAPDMESSFFLDTLMRSAASYGETNGADFIETATAEYNAFLNKQGFTVDDTHAFTPMSTIVHYS